MLRWRSLTLLTIFGALHSAEGSCGCLGTDGLAAALGSKAFLTMNGVDCLPVRLASGAGWCYPKDYGSRCKPWDQELPATCADRSGNAFYDRPAWCEDKWCYVDTSNRDCTNFYPSGYFSGLFYSYASACNSKNSFESYKDSNARVGDLKTVLHSYVKSGVKVAIEALTNQDMVVSKCSPVTGCSCPGCKAQAAPWNVDAGVDLETTGYFAMADQGTDKTKCLAGSLHSTYERQAEKEGSIGKLGYMYFGSQEDGSMTQWPAMEWCPETMDYRFRPWYASAASGPKDVVIIVDTSGSMVTQDRISLARNAAKKVLETLVESDYAVVVRFSSDATSSSDTLVSMTTAEQTGMKTWLDSNINAGGSTNFKEAFSKTFSVLTASRAAGKSANCKTIILFMSDGDPSDWDDQTETDYAWLKTEAEKVGETMIMTYALGSGISNKGKTILKRIACSHRGIYHMAGDGSDLGSTMAEYYSFFAVGKDSASLQWREYKDGFTKAKLLAACLPALDRTTTPRTLLGVSCMDMNVLIGLNELEAASGYQDFLAAYTAAQSFCSPFRMSAADAQLLRFRSSAQAVCDTADGVAAVLCGDGVVDAKPGTGNTEECDDGNTQSGDGCSSSCKLEIGWQCPRFGFLPQTGAMNGMLKRPRLWCQGDNLESPVSTVGVATAWSYCRESTTAEFCAVWCLNAAGCVSFNFYANSWGMTNGCCFRKSSSAMEFLDSTDCYEKLQPGAVPCRDDTSFMDEQKFQCHAWQGYDCSTAVSEYSYTPAGQAALIAACQSSCAVCSGAICTPKCSQFISAPSECKDCVGSWKAWGTCSAGTIVDKPGGRVECVQERKYQVITAGEAGWAACPYTDDSADFRMVDIYNPSSWSSCLVAGSSSKACGAGVRTRVAPCLVDPSTCSFGDDFLPALGFKLDSSTRAYTLEEACTSQEGCAGGGKGKVNTAKAAARHKLIYLVLVLILPSLF